MTAATIDRQVTIGTGKVVWTIKSENDDKSVTLVAPGKSAYRVSADRIHTLTPVDGSAPAQEAHVPAPTDSTEAPLEPTVHADLGDACACGWDPSLTSKNPARSLAAHVSSSNRAAKR